MPSCPWLPEVCVCGGPRSLERTWYNRELGYLTGYVISESSKTLRIQLTQPLAQAPSVYPIGARIDLSPELTKEAYFGG